MIFGLIFKELTRSNLIELFFIALLDGKNKTLRSRILQKISTIIKEDFDESDLKAAHMTAADTSRRSQIPAEAQVEREFYYESKWK